MTLLNFQVNQHAQRKNQRHALSESSETEAEMECGLSLSEYNASIAWKIGQVKVPSNQNKAKSMGEIKKRIIVGFFVLSWFVVPMFVHPLAIQFVTLQVSFISSYEIFHIQKKTFEASLLYPAQQITLVLCLYILVAPRLGMLERSIMEESGFSAAQNPVLFAVLYDYNGLIVLSSFSLFFVVQLYLWKKRHMRYQLEKNLATTLFMTYVSFYGAVACYTYAKAGRWWLYFAILSVALNDACAYFVGKLFGRHQLIGLSPNKTIEGYIGGLISNLLITYVCATYYLQGDFW